MLETGCQYCVERPLHSGGKRFLMAGDVLGWPGKDGFSGKAATCQIKFRVNPFVIIPCRFKQGYGT